MQAGMAKDGLCFRDSVWVAQPSGAQLGEEQLGCLEGRVRDHCDAVYSGVRRTCR